MVIGPVIAEGFYYDIYSERPFTPEDLAAIEKRMQELIAQDYDVIKKVTPRAEVIELFKQRGEDYKLRLIEDMPDDVTAMGLYYHQEYVDMCRGPHVPNTRFLKAFKLTRISGAYWRGDAKNEQLQRIYGTAWADKKQLEAYILRMEEADKRDHRKIGKQQDLFHLQEEGPGPGVLAPQGLVDLAGGRAVHAQGLPRQRLRRGALPADPGRVAVAEVRPLGQLPGQHVLHRVGEAHLRGQADELPGPRAGVQPGPAQLPRPADPLRRVRRLPPQRAVRRAARHPARARLHPGRRPHLLHRAADRGRGHRLPPAGAEGVRRLRLRRHPDQDRLAPGKAPRRRRHLGQGRGRAARRARRLRGGVAGAAGRGRFLRPEDRVPPEGRDRPHLAARHHAWIS